MKKIIISLVAIVAVGAAAVGGTIAFYNDTETSAANVFTAGTIDITVDSSGAVYNDGTLNGSNWDATDLTDEKFFNFDDIKPADRGNRNISLHVGDNDAWACLLVTNKVNDENTIIDPETIAGDTTNNPNGGELGQNIEVFVWQDNNSNGTYESASDDALTAENGVTLDTLGNIKVADSTFGTPLTNGNTRQVYVAWCAGDQTVDGSNGTIACDGGGMGDVVQTDKFSADITAYAVQVRHNSDFKCSDVQLLN
jgi:predicted ribosomally synthesized peptide with SipW-like signal peptide